MKKFGLLFLAIVMVLSFCGCGEDETVTRGVVEGSKYTSESLDMEITAPDGWVFYSDEEIADLQSVSEDSFDIENIDSTKLLYDMMCIDTDTGASISVIYENLNLLYGSVLDEDGYLELAKENYMDQMGDYIDSVEQTTVKVDGKEFSCLKVAVNYSGLEMQQLMLVKKVGQHMAVVSVAEFSEEGIDELLGCFSVK